jgi:hypothetical protein
MRTLSLALAIFAVVWYAPSFAGEASRDHEVYRGYYSDLSAVSGRQDFQKIHDALRRQIDIVEGSKLSPHVTQFFRTVPIVVDDFGCAGAMTSSLTAASKPLMATACYGSHVPDSLRKNADLLIWDSKKADWSSSDPVARAQASAIGVIMVRPSITSENERPVLLHELLHAYHHNILPGREHNPAVQFWFKQAAEQKLYPADQYLMTNEREFFAVTASVFLSGRDGSITRERVRTTQPEYYKYLAWLFGYDPEHSSKLSPVASAE